MSIVLNGSNQYAYADEAFTTSTGDKDQTLAFFVKPQTLAVTGYPVAANDTTTDFTFFTARMEPTSDIAGRHKTAASILTAYSTLTNDAWTPVVVTFEAATDTVTIYAGSTTGVSASGTASTFTWSRLTIGAVLGTGLTPADFLKGKVAYAMYFERVWNSTEINAFINAAAVADINAISTANRIARYDLIADGNADGAGVGLTLVNAPTFDSDDPFAAATLGVTAVNTNNTITDGQTAIAVTGDLLNTVTSAIIETDDGVYQQDVTASFSASDANNATFNHARGVTPLTTASYQLRLALSDGTDTVYAPIIVNPASGFQVVELAGTLQITEPESGFAPYTGPDPVVGDQYIVPLLTTQGAAITGNADTTLAYDYTGISPVPDQDSHSIEWWSSNGTSRVWSSGTINLDQPPKIAGITATTPGTVGLGQDVSITVAIDQVVNVGGAGTPYLTIALDDGVRQASYVSGTGTSDLVFTYTVQEFEDAKNGVIVTGLELNGGTIQDAGGNNLILPLESDVTLATLIVDAGPDLAPTLGTPTITSSSISLPISYAGTDLTGYEYSLDGGAWTNTGSPLQLSALAASTAFNIDVRAKSATGYGPTASTIVTTSSATDAVPNAFAFTPQTGVARSVTVVSNSITVTGVDAGLDIPVSVTGGEYSVSTDGGQTYGGWTSAPTNVRLNYQVRVRHTSSNEYSSGGYNGVRTTTLDIGGVTADFVSTTLADTTPPVISLVGGNVSIVEGTAFVEPGYTATDNADGDITVSGVVVTGSVDTNTPGTYTLTYTATDASGNQSSVTRLVTVTEFVPADTTDPVISLVGGNRTLVAGDTWVDPGYTATDDTDGDITDQVVVTGNVNTAAPGSYILTYTVQDAAGNQASTTRTVTVLPATQYPIVAAAPTTRTYIAERIYRPEAGAKHFVLHVGEVLDFDFDLTAWLAAEGDDLAEGSHQIKETAAGLEVLASGVVPNTSRVKVWLSASSVDGNDAYPVQLTITTTGNRVVVFQFYLVVIDRMAA